MCRYGDNAVRGSGPASTTTSARRHIAKLADLESVWQGHGEGTSARMREQELPAIARPSRPPGGITKAYSSDTRVNADRGDRFRLATPRKLFSPSADTPALTRISRPGPLSRCLPVRENRNGNWHRMRINRRISRLAEDAGRARSRRAPFWILVAVTATGTLAMHILVPVSPLAARALSRWRQFSTPCRG